MISHPALEGRTGTPDGNAWHPNGHCGGRKCYYKGATAAGTSTPPKLWDGGKIVTKKTKLEDMWATLPDAPEKFDKGVGKDAEMPYRDAKDSYRTGFDKMRHSAKNFWWRKTETEQIAFVTKNLVSAALAAGGGAGHQAAEVAGGEAVRATVEHAHTLALSIGIDASATALDELDESALETLIGAEFVREADPLGAANSQEALRKAAQHVFEISRILSKETIVKGADVDNCDDAREYVYYAYLIQHHLEKIQLYLKDPMKKVEWLCDYLEKELKNWGTYRKYLQEAMNDFMSPNGWKSKHRNCKGAGGDFLDEATYDCYLQTRFGGRPSDPRGASSGTL
jgi:hypothetical protein